MSQGVKSQNVRPAEKLTARSIYNLLLKHYGEQGWWPGDSPFEVAVGAILVQRTTWKNAANAIAHLKTRDLLIPERLVSVGEDDLTSLIRPIGMAGEKAKRLIALSTEIARQGTLEKLLNKSDAGTLLRKIRGVGDETADSILLYSGGKLALPIGEYTRRILTRIGLKKRSYIQWQRLLTSSLPRSVKTYREAHALYVAHGKKHCKSIPKCSDCPLLQSCEYGTAKLQSHSPSRRKTLSAHSARSV